MIMYRLMSWGIKPLRGGQTYKQWLTESVVHKNPLWEMPDFYTTPLELLIQYHHSQIPGAVVSSRDSIMDNL